MSKRVYKFISAEYGVSNLRDHHLKLSTIDDLNDPFDLGPVDTTDPEIRYAIENLVVWFRQTSAILCFSRNWDNLLLWSHYGASHAGVCLGFDIPDGEARYDTDVLYQPNVIKVRKEDINLAFVDRLLRTKHESWSYEQEVRMFVRLNDPPDEKGLRWMDFGPNLELKDVIIGSQCKPEDSDAIVEVLEPYGDAVKCWWAGMREDSFLLVRLEGAPWWHADMHRART
jgi:hypothetical protein